MRSSSNFRWRLVAILAVFAMIAAACGTESTSTTEGDTGQTPATTAAPATTTGDSPATTAAPTVEGFEYKIAVIEDFTTDNVWAWYDTENSVYNQYLLAGSVASVYGQIAPTYTLAPSLALPADPPIGEADGDNWVIDVPLRDTQRWSDGEPIDANDVAFTFNTAVEFGLGGNFLAAYPQASADDPDTEEDEFTLGLISVEAIDDYTVRYTWNGQPGLALWQFGAAQGPVFPEHFWADVIAGAASLEDVETASGEGMPSASGMAYAGREEGSFARNVAVADYYDRGAQTTVYANGAVEWTSPDGTTENWGGTPGGDVIADYTTGPFASETLFSVYGGQDQAVLALTEGDVDYWITPLGLQRGLQGQVLAAGDLEVISNPAAGFRYLSFNTRKFPMSDTSFRQAVACMIDKEFMANNVLQGVAVPLDSTVPPGAAYWANQDIEAWCAGQSQSERVASAIQILKDGGWTWTTEPGWDEGNRDVIPKGEGLRGPGGESVPELTLLAPGPGYDPLRATYSLFIEDWANDLGIPVSAEPTGFNVIVDRVFGPVDWDMYILGWGVGIFPDHVTAFFECSGDSATGGFNTPGYCNDEFDALAAQFNEATELEVARDLVQQMDAIVARDVPYVVLFTTPILEAYRNTLQFPFTDTLDGVQNWLGTPDLVGQQ